ncbi:MAG: Fur family transcriptional regulator [Armatimonadota bacterium]
MLDSLARGWSTFRPPPAAAHAAVRGLLLLRPLHQRTAIRRVFEQIDRPLSPHEVLRYAQREVSGLGIATVYRNLKALVDEGSLIPVHLPGEAPLYEPAGKAHHHHFQCDRCHHVFDLGGCLLSMRKLAQRKFKVLRHELTLYGVCADCREGG